MVQSFIQKRYQDTLDFLYHRLPMFERVGNSAFKKDLTNIRALCLSLDNPHEKFKSIHIAGTNGKGSVSHLLASIFQESGYKTGLYISPHYKDFRERIRVDGQFISKQYLVDFVERIKPDIDLIRPSFFEISVAMAFDYFAKMKIDLAIVETGLGGRLDSTNIITPLLSIITNISLDHQNMLGDTIEKIAVEKAGIMKPGVSCLIGEYDKASYPVFKDKATSLSIRLYCADKTSSTKKVNEDQYKFQDTKKLKPAFIIRSSLGGAYQERNINTVLNAIQVMNKESKFSISFDQMQAGFDRLVDHVPLIGRWQWINQTPKVLADAAHNLAGIQTLFKEVKKLYTGQLHCVFGTVKDKEVEPVLSILPTEAQYYFVNADLPRAMPSDLLTEKAGLLGLKGRSYGRVGKGLSAAKKSAKPGDLVLVTGSIFVVAEVI